MPLTLVLYMVGALSISGAPVFNGFVSKSLVLSGVAADHRAFAAMLLNLAGVGTFLSVALKLPFFAWGPGEHEVRSAEAPASMLVAMGAAAALCVFLGVAPGWLYARLPFGAVDYDPFTAAHIFESLLMMAGAGVAFVQLLRRLEPHPLRSLDCDEPYRIAAEWLRRRASLDVEQAAARLGGAVAAGRDAIAAAARNPAVAMARVWRGDSAAEMPRFDPDAARPPIGRPIAWLFAAFVVVALLLVAAPW